MFSIGNLKAVFESFHKSPHPFFHLSQEILSKMPPILISVLGLLSFGFAWEKPALEERTFFYIGGKLAASSDICTLLTLGGHYENVTQVDCYLVEIHGPWTKQFSQSLDSVKFT